MPRKRPPSEFSTDALTAARDKRGGEWTLLERIQMDRTFVSAMLRAGFALTAASTVAGTRCPIAGYVRGD